MSINSNDPVLPIIPVELSGAYIYFPEGGNEPNLAEIALVFGYQ